MKTWMPILPLLLTLFAGLAVAGPNLGGVLVVHEPGLLFSTVDDLPVPPPTLPLTSCFQVDANAPIGSPTEQCVWKVYAAFPDGSSPRVKGLAWGIFGLGDFWVTVAGLPDPPNCFQVVSGSWPSPPGSIGQSFVYTQTAQFVECYWFGGYGYSGTFSTCPHATYESVFVDDATPANFDAIWAFGSMGFGENGYVPCLPPPPPQPGACCNPDDGSCVMLYPDACLPPNNFVGGPCLPNNPCPQPPPTGACCLNWEGDCQVLTEQVCGLIGGYYAGDGVPCTATLCFPTPAETQSWGRVKATYR